MSDKPKITANEIFLKNELNIAVNFNCNEYLNHNTVHSVKNAASHAVRSLERARTTNESIKESKKIK
jgi:hypothetical protein